MANTVNASEAGAGFQPTEPGLTHATIGSGRQTTRVCNAEFNQGGLATTIYIYRKIPSQGIAVEKLLVHESTTHNTLRENQNAMQRYCRGGTPGP